MNNKEKKKSLRDEKIINSIKISYHENNIISNDIIDEIASSCYCLYYDVLTFLIDQNDSNNIDFVIYKTCIRNNIFIEFTYMFLIDKKYNLSMLGDKTLKLLSTIDGFYLDLISPKKKRKYIKEKVLNLDHIVDLKSGGCMYYRSFNGVTCYQRRFKVIDSHIIIMLLNKDIESILIFLDNKLFSEKGELPCGDINNFYKPKDSPPEYDHRLHIDTLMDFLFQIYDKKELISMVNILVKYKKCSLIKQIIENINKYL